MALKKKASPEPRPLGGAAPKNGVGRSGTVLGFTRLHALFLGFYLALGLVHAYAVVARYDQVEQTQNDPSQYLAMTQGQPLEQILRVYRWRVLTPLAVRLMPSPPVALSQHYQIDPIKVIRFKYAVWNTLGNVAAAFMLLLLMQALGFGLLQACIGGLLYSLSTQVMLDGAMMLVDPWANAAIAAALYFSLKERFAGLFLAFGLGLFVKETLAVVPAYIVLMGRPKWLNKVLLLAPAVAVYAYFRYVMYPGGEGVAFNSAWILGALGHFTSLGQWVYAAAEFTLHFMVLAPLAWMGWKASAAFPDLRRMAWLLPALAVTPIILGTELTRPWFNGFPVFIPLAVLGLWELTGQKVKN